MSVRLENLPEEEKKESGGLFGGLLGGKKKEEKGAVGEDSEVGMIKFYHLSVIFTVNVKLLTLTTNYWWIWLTVVVGMGEANDGVSCQKCYSFQAKDRRVQLRQGNTHVNTNATHCNTPTNSSNDTLFPIPPPPPPYRHVLFPPRLGHLVQDWVWWQCTTSWRNH